MTLSGPYHQQLHNPLPETLKKSSDSLLMQDILYKVLCLSRLDTHVIVIGEIGSGKKSLARTIYENSTRNEGPFHMFYCVDIKESEYKDAFWEQLQFEDDHITLKYDAIEKASNGILYMDQFSELPSHFMIDIIDSYLKGCNQLFRYNMASKPRLILSMNQDSYQKLQSTPTWNTLLQKLDPVAMMLPPLRERREDIPQFIHVFLDEIREKYTEWKELSISSQAIQECFNYSWPGNLRQLKNAILQGAILSYGQTIESHHLPFSMNWKLPYEFQGY